MHLVPSRVETDKWHCLNDKMAVTRDSANLSELEPHPQPVSRDAIVLMLEDE
jgi:hypothetical protein